MADILTDDAIAASVNMVKVAEEVAKACHVSVAQAIEMHLRTVQAAQRHQAEQEFLAEERRLHLTGKS